MSPSAEVHEGLEGVVVTRTALSRVDGEAGRLVIAGADVETLARTSTFEEAVARIFSAAGIPVDRIDARIREGREEAFAIAARLAPALTCSEPMVALRVATDLFTPDIAEDPARIVGALGWVAAVHARGSVIAPSASGHAHDLMRIMADGPALDTVRGAAPDTPEDPRLATLRSASLDSRAAALGAYLVTVMDHGMNASTFAARVVASTASDVLSCVAAALAALKGPLHGGAPGPVLDMLDAINTPENAEKWLENEIAAKRRIMGMGHRVYRVRDPRAAVLEAACSKLEAAGVTSARLPLARAVEKIARDVLAKRYPNRALDTNVEFYTAVLLDTAKVPRTHFSAMFAAGRVAGWLAHVAEQRAKGRLIRPESEYVGADPFLGPG
jgi:citrate synthase